MAAAKVVVSFQTAPLLSVIGPVNVIALAVVFEEPKFIVPVIFVAPLTVIARSMVTVPPLLIVNVPKVIVPAVSLNVPPSETKLLLTVIFPPAVMVPEPERVKL